jgi:hypothetical protein
MAILIIHETMFDISVYKKIHSNGEDMILMELPFYYGYRTKYNLNISGLKLAMMMQLIRQYYIKNKSHLHMTLEPKFLKYYSGKTIKMFDFYDMEIKEYIKKLCLIYNCQLIIYPRPESLYNSASKILKIDYDIDAYVQKKINKYKNISIPSSITIGKFALWSYGMSSNAKLLEYYKYNVKNINAINPPKQTKIYLNNKIYTKTDIPIINKFISQLKEFGRIIDTSIYVYILASFFILIDCNMFDFYAWLCNLSTDFHCWTAMIFVKNIYPIFKSGLSDSLHIYLYEFLSKKYQHVSIKSKKKTNKVAILIWDSLFWRFMHVYRKNIMKYYKNKNILSLYRTWDKKFSDNEKNKHIKIAEYYIKRTRL